MTDDLLVKFLLGEAGDTEQQEVEHWIKASREHAAYFHHFSLIWEQSKKLASESKISEDRAWERFQQRVQQRAARQHTRRVSLFNNSWARAASILLLVAAGWLGYRNVWLPSQLLVLSSADTAMTETLPDGSVVTLNKHSRLTCPKRFAGGNRDVKLEGEAFFDITPDKQHPFIIAADGVSVKVVGTSFNVKTNKERTEVIVETGIVEVSKKKSMVRVKPNEKVTVLRSSAPVKEKNEDAFYNYYRTNEFNCVNTPLWRLADVLGEAFNVRIQFAKPEIKDLKLTTTFHNEPLDNIITVICETFDLTAERNGKDIILK